MKRILSASLLAAAAMLASCSSDTKTEEQGTATTTEEQTATAAPADTTLTEDKAQLMQTIAQHSKLQVELGKLAAAKGTTDAVKQYAPQLVQNYTTKQKELQEVAQTYNATIDTTLKENYRKHLDNLNNKKAADFDKAFWENVTDAQKKTLDEYDNVLKDITGADATAFGIWARTSEKELRAQYEQALAQQQELKNRM